MVKKDLFFISNSSKSKSKSNSIKRKQNDNNVAKNGLVSKPRNTSTNTNAIDNDTINDDTDLLNDFGKIESEDENLLDHETPALKRLRLAKSYLEKVKENLDDDIMEGEIDAAQMDRELISERLAKDADQYLGKTFHTIADNYKNINFNVARHFKSSKNSHQLSISCMAVSRPKPKTFLSSKESDSMPIYIYSGSKDAVLVKWDFWTGKKLSVILGGLKPTKRLERQIGKKNIHKKQDGHCDEILCMDTSFDGKYLVTGGLDKIIYVWSTTTDKILATFIQHRDAISGLAFRKGQNQLYSCSFDRTVKVWNVDQLSYIETLFGHQDKITNIDTLGRERCLTSGSRDRTCRLWKIPEESQLVFRGGGGGLTVSEDIEVLETLGGPVQRKREKDNGASGGSIEQVSMLDEEYFVSGSDSGAISLWINSKKKPLYTRLKCHGTGSRILINGAETVLGQDFGDGCCWITSLTTIRYSDLFASGSADGYIRFWKLSETKKSFSLVNCIPVAGFVNSLAFFNAPPLNNHEKQSVNFVQEFGNSEAAKRIMKNAENSNKRHQIGNNELYIAAAIGSEHRLGRWWKMKGIKNSIYVSSLGAAFI